MSISYKKRPNHAVNAQLAILGPANASREQIETAIAHKVRRGTDPRGFTIRWTDWQGADVAGAKQDQFFRIFRNFAEESEQDISDPFSQTSDPELFDRESESDSEE